jgi:hypothetical protein
MERPKITGFFGEEITLEQVHKTYLKQPSLYNYAQSVDRYCDELEKTNTEQAERIKELEEDCKNFKKALGGLVVGCSSCERNVIVKV